MREIRKIRTEYLQKNIYSALKLEYPDLVPGPFHTKSLSSNPKRTMIGTNRITFNGVRGSSWHFTGQVTLHVYTTFPIDSKGTVIIWIQDGITHHHPTSAADKFQQDNSDIE